MHVWDVVFKTKSPAAKPLIDFLKQHVGWPEPYAELDVEILVPMDGPSGGIIVRHRFPDMATEERAWAAWTATPKAEEFFAGISEYVEGWDVSRYRVDE